VERNLDDMVIVSYSGRAYVLIDSFVRLAASFLLLVVLGTYLTLIRRVPISYLPGTVQMSLTALVLRPPQSRQIRPLIKNVILIREATPNFLGCFFSSAYSYNVVCPRRGQS
jgi:hypothetical protein